MKVHRFASQVVATIIVALASSQIATDPQSLVIPVFRMTGETRDPEDRCDALFMVLPCGLRRKIHYFLTSAHADMHVLSVPGRRCDVMDAMM